MNFKGKHEDLTGRKFNRLTVLEFGVKKGRYPTWKCKCDCGNETVIYDSSLKSGATKSCGCYWKEQNSKLHTTHGKSKTKLYKIWVGIKTRCLNKNTPNYKNYGEKGVKLCKEWEEYVNFEKWALNNGYTQNLSIERIDVYGNYEPNNCKWATREEQSKNKRNNVYIEYDGERKIMTDWARHFNVTKANIHYYVKNNRVNEGFERLTKKMLSK